MASGVVATVICAVFGMDPKKVRLITSIIVAYVPLFLTTRRKVADLVVAPFNGCLIFFTLVGASSFYPYVNKDTVATTATATNTSTSAFAPWVPDANLVAASQNLTAIALEQSKTLNQVSNTISVFEEKTRTMNLSPAVRSELTRDLTSNRVLLHSTTTNLAPRVLTLKKLGIRP